MSMKISLWTLQLFLLAFVSRGNAGKSCLFIIMDWWTVKAKTNEKIDIM